MARWPQTTTEVERRRLAPAGLLHPRLLLLLAPLWTAASCDTTPSGLPEVVYVGNASDEALERFWDKIGSAALAPMSAATVTSPAPNEILPAEPAPTIRWSFPQASKRSAPRRRWALPPLFGARPAFAHLPPVTGGVVLIEFRASADEAQPLRMFATGESWAMDSASWARLRAAGRPITLRVFSGYVNNNILEEGPFTREDGPTFTIGGGG